MSDENCEITVSSCLSVAFPETVWRNDILIPTPILRYPLDDRTFCLDVLAGESQICLFWEPVIDATVYLVQWALNPDFNGPSVREVIINAPQLFYCLLTPEDIRQGETIYWRIQAANKLVGGVSNKSAVRKLTYNCNTSQDRQIADKCAKYNVNIVVHGEDTMGCCDKRTYWAELTFDCKAPDDSNLITVESTEWTIKKQASDVIITEDVANKYTAKLESCSDTTQVVQVFFEVTFVDILTATTFTCSGNTDVLLDCEINSPDDIATTDNVTAPIGNEITCGVPYNVSCSECDCGTSCVVEEVSIFPPGMVILGTTYTNRVSDTDNCTIQYDLELDIQYDPNFNLVYVEKGEGKSTTTTPTSEVATLWEFEITNPSSKINFHYTGCANQDTAVFLGSVDPAFEDINFGSYLSCDTTEESNIITLSGPVVTVGDSCEPWPSCYTTDSCCEYAKMELDGRPMCIGVPIIYHNMCDCCEDGIATLEVTLVSVAVDCVTELVNATLDVIETCNDMTNTRQLTTPDHLCGLSNTSNISFFGGECTLAFRNVLGRYDTAQAPPMGLVTCDCVPTSLSVTLNYDGNSGTISPILRENGAYTIPAVDENELILGNKTFSLSRLYFDTCILTAVICDSEAVCSSCSSLRCVCFGDCGFGAREIDIVVTYNDTFGNQTFNRTLVLNCNSDEYSSERFIVQTKSGCQVTGQVVIRGGVVRIEAEADQPYDWFIAVPVCPTNEINGQIATSIPCPIQGFPNNTDNFTISVAGTPVVCGCFETILGLTATECDPFEAAATYVVDGKDLVVTANAFTDDTCGCYGNLTNIRDEARIDIALGCGLTVVNEGNCGSEIVLDIERLIGKNSEHGYFELIDEEDTNFTSGSTSEDAVPPCPFISPPVCECVNGYPLYKNSNHCARTQSFIGAGEYGLIVLTEDPFDDQTTLAKNIGPGDCDVGTSIIMHVTNDCKNVFLCPCCDGTGSPSDPSECQDCPMTIDLTMFETTHTGVAPDGGCQLPPNCQCYSFAGATWPIECGPCPEGNESWDVDVYCCDNGSMGIAISRFGCAIPEDTSDLSGSDTTFFDTCSPGGTASGFVDMYLSPTSPGDTPVCTIAYTMSL